MKTLDDAWSWYGATRQNLERMNRLGRKYWGQLPWDGELGRDDDFRILEAADIEAETRISLDFIDDLAIVVLFSVFEQGVRDHIGGELLKESEAVQHPVLKKAADDAIRGVEEGSFFKVLEPYKATGHADLIEEVNQVRRYRNWVAHGRRGAQPPAVDPRKAYLRLVQLLEVITRPE